MNKTKRSPCRLFLALILLVCLFSSGCSREWKKKFLRRRKNVAPPQAVLVLQPDVKAIYPPADRYREHYAFWKSWNEELLISLGQIHKRDVRYLSGVVGELRSMQALLSGRPADQLREILIQLSDMEDRWKRAPDTWQIPVSDRTKLERFQREIGRKFSYSDVKESLVPDPKP